MGMTVKKSRVFMVLLLALAILMSGLAGSMSVFAAAGDTPTKQLTDYIRSDTTGLGKTQYEKEGGGSVSGSTLLKSDGTLDEGYFQSLKSKEQTRFVSDVTKYADEAVVKVGDVSEGTVQDWYKLLQSQEGVGSKFMLEILKDTKPDFVTARRIWEPFSSPISTALGILTIAVMALLGLVMASDIAYIVIPFVRIFGDTNFGHHRKEGSKSLFFSYAAMRAVETAENGGNSDGGNKYALWEYFKYRVWELIVLGICLMYLSSGQIYVLVGWVLDLVNGFLGF